MSEDSKANKAKKKTRTKLIKFETTEIRGRIPVELYEKVLGTAAAMGLTKGDILKAVLTEFVATKTEIRNDFVEEKAEQLGITKLEAKSEIIKSYEEHSRSKRANLE